jgi:type IV pilus assembly protein PilE
MTQSVLLEQGQRGFTLIELLIALVIVAILAAVAIPNYTEYVQRGRRQEAKAQLLQLAQWQERFRTQTNAYATTTNALPAGLRTVNVNGAAAYTITINEPDAMGVGGATANTYTLTATRAGVMANDPCGDFTLTHLNVRGLANNTRTVDQCWGR